MLNPLIHKHPDETLHHVYCVLDFIDMLPNPAGNSAVLSREEMFGYFCIIQCIKDALRFECARTNTAEPDSNKQLNIREIIVKIEAMQHSKLKATLFAEFTEALYICT